RRPRHRGDTAPTQPSGLRGRPLPPQPFVHLRPQRLVDAPNPFGNLCILHARLKGPKPPVSRKIVQVIFGQALSRASSAFGCCGAGAARRVAVGEAVEMALMADTGGFAASAMMGDGLGLV